MNSLFDRAHPRPSEAFSPRRAATAPSLEPLEARIAPAQVVATWIGATDGNWGDAFNWDIGVVPNNGVDTYAVMINLPTNPFITVSQNITIDSLTSSENIEVLNGTFSVQSALANTGLLYVAGAGRISLDGNFTTAQLGSFQADDAGIISIAGTLDNTSATLSLSSLTGSLELNGGVIIGGTISTTDATALKLTPTSNLIDGVTLAGDLIVGPDSSLSVINGLTLSGGRLRIEAGPLDQSAGVFFNGTQTLGGTGEVLFGGSSNGINVLQTVGSPSQGATLTIGSGVTLHGSRGGQLNSAFNLDAIFNQGTISSETAGEVISINAQTFVNQGTVSSSDGILEINGNWTNPTGTLTVSGPGHLNFGGNFETADIGSISRSGGVIHITGILDNTGSTLALNATTGSFTLLTGGLILGGTVTGAEGAGLLLLSMHSGALSGVTLATDLTIPENSTLTVLNGLTLSGAMLTLAGGSQDASLDFVGTQTLAGVGQIIWGGSTSANIISVVGAGNSVAQSATLTIGPGITVIAQQGGTLRGEFASDQIVNQGTIGLTEASQTLTLNASAFTNEGNISIASGNLTNLGAFTQTNGSLFLQSASVNSGTPMIFAGGALVGTGVIFGAVSNTGAYVEPGGGVAGTLVISGDYTQAATGTLAFEIGGTNPGSDYDQLIVSGNAVLNGTLKINRYNSYVLGSGGTFELLSANSVSGTFTSIEDAAPLSLSYDATTFQLIDESVVYTWDGSDSDDWFTAANWTPEGVPGERDVVIFNLASMIRLSSDASVFNFSQFNGTLSGTGDLTIFGTASWSGGMMSGTGSTNILGELTIDGGVVELADRILYIDPDGLTMIAGNGGALRMSGQALVNNEGLFLNTFNSGGIMAGPSSTTSAFLNNGVFSADGNVRVEVPFLNAGGISLSEVSLTFSAGFSQDRESGIAGTGTIRFEGGVASVAGTIAGTVINDGAVFAPGGVHTPGSLLISGSYEQMSGTLALDLGGLVPGVTHDIFAITGSATLDGTLAVNTVGGYVIKDGANFPVLTYASTAGSFTNVDAPAGVTIAPTANGLALSAQAPALAGRTVTFEEPDGDVITITVNKGSIPAGAITAGPNGEIKVDLRAVDSKLTGGKVTISVTREDDGDPDLTIDQIRADGLNLNKLVVKGDVGEVDIGSGNGKKPAIKILSVQSLGGGDVSADPDAEPAVSDINGSLGKLIIGGDVRNAVLFVAGKLGNVTIGGDFIGETTGVETIAALQDALRGNPRVGGGIPVGSFNAESIGSFKVAGGVKSGGVSAEGNIGSVSVAGDVNGGGIAAGGRIKVVKVFGSMMSDDPESPFVVAALAQKKGKSNAPGIDTIMVKNNVENARILLGYNKDQQPTNADASVKKVIVKGDWIASSLVAGVVDATGDGFGINDTTFPDDTTTRVVGSIASIVIQGTATGSATEGEHFAITAQKIGKLSINGEKVDLDKKEKDDILLDEVNGNFRVVEL